MIHDVRQRTLHASAALFESGDHDAAIAMLRDALKRDPRDPAALRMLGYALVLQDNVPEGLRHLEFASKLDPDNPEILCNLAMGYRRMDRLGEAHKALDRVLGVDPSYGRAVTLKALLLQSRGQSEKALGIVRDALAVRNDPVVAVAYAKLSRELGTSSDALGVVRGALEDPALTRTHRMDLLSALGDLLDALGEYDDAFAAYAASNAMQPVGEPVDFGKYKARWARGDLDALGDADVDASRVVLVVGMPRSGTTLTEQIIGAHKQARGIGESAALNDVFRGACARDLDRAGLTALGRSYIEQVCGGTDASRVVDKMPENYCYLGAVSRALPGAHVVHCTRDPRDTCLSIFFQRFSPAIRYATDLEATARHYLGYLDLMEHWRETLDLDILDSSYEALTREKEPRVRALLDHVGLGFDARCMEHHKHGSSVHTASVGQVRKPLYTSSTARWKRYERHLGPMLEVLSVLDLD